MSPNPGVIKVRVLPIKLSGGTPGHWNWASCGRPVPVTGRLRTPSHYNKMSAGLSLIVKNCPTDITVIDLMSFPCRMLFHYHLCRTFYYTRTLKFITAMTVLRVPPFIIVLGRYCPVSRGPTIIPLRKIWVFRGEKISRFAALLGGTVVTELDDKVSTWYNM